jgi:hypothetical protein
MLSKNTGYNGEEFRKCLLYVMWNQICGVVKWDLDGVRNKVTKLTGEFVRNYYIHMDLQKKSG